MPTSRSGLGSLTRVTGGRDERSETTELFTTLARYRLTAANDAELTDCDRWDEPNIYRAAYAFEQAGDWKAM